MERQIPFKFNAEFDTNSLIPTSDPELYTTKVRVFYKGLNRNGSFITDKFANELAKSAYSKPIIGTYSFANSDFLGHEGAAKAKAYGYVIPNSLTWTDHLDDDGVTRNYATYDTVIWSRYWDEAKLIPQKTQSMEIDPLTIEGDWRVVDDFGNTAYSYTKGTIAGLTILGDSKEPCFEGAAFFSTNTEDYKNFTSAIEKFLSQGGLNNMDTEKEKLEVAADNEEVIVEPVAETVEEQILEQTAEEQPVEETAEEPVVEQPTEVVEETEQEVTEEVAEPENATEPQEDNANTEENPEEGAEENGEENDSSNEFNYEEEFAKKDKECCELNEKYEKLNSEFLLLKDNFNQRVEEYEKISESFTNLQNEFSELKSNYEDLQSKYETACSESKEKDEVIAAYKVIASKYELNAKQAVIDKFSKCLPAEIMQTIVEDSDNLSVEELNTRCAVEYTNFSLANPKEDEIRIPHPAQEKPALYTILERYKK